MFSAILPLMEDFELSQSNLKFSFLCEEIEGANGRKTERCPFFFFICRVQISAHSINIANLLSQLEILFFKLP